MDGRSELLAYLGSATATIVVLFGVQFWYASYLDVAVVHGPNAGAPLSPVVTAARAQEQQELGRLQQAKAALVRQGRGGVPLIAPKPSEDLSAMSGWIHEPGFTAYAPRAQPTPHPQAAVAPGGGVASEGEAAQAPSEAAPQAIAKARATAAAAKAPVTPAPPAPAPGTERAP